MSLINHVVKCINLAELGICKLHTDIYYLNGMSSPKGRRLLNLLCETPQTYYLEIGCWRGSTLISALYGNEDTIQKAIAIDSFQEFEKTLFVNSINFEDSPVRNADIPLVDLPVKEELSNNIIKYLHDSRFWCFDWPHGGDKLKFYDRNCFDPELIKELVLLHENSINIYFYDGNHEEEAQYQAFVSYDKVFAKQFIAVVDDWNNKNAENGTRRAFKDLGYNILCEAILPANGNGDVFNYWAGMGVFVIDKQPSPS